MGEADERVARPLSRGDGHDQTLAECSTSLKQWRPALCTNLTGSIQVARAVVPHLRAQGGGRI